MKGREGTSRKGKDEAKVGGQEGRNDDIIVQFMEQKHE